MAAVYYSIRGIEELKAKLAVAALKTKPVAGAALKVFAERIMEDSKAKYVPVGPTTDTVSRFKKHGFKLRGDPHSGALRDSGKVDDPEIDMGEVSVRMSYGGGGIAAPYAIAVHEHLSQYSPPTWRGTTVTFTQGGPKYLEIPVMEHTRTMAVELSSVVSLILR